MNTLTRENTGNFALSVEGDLSILSCCYTRGGYNVEVIGGGGKEVLNEGLV